MFLSLRLTSLDVDSHIISREACSFTDNQYNFLKFITNIYFVAQGAMALPKYVHISYLNTTEGFIVFNLIWVFFAQHFVTKINLR